MIAPSVLLIEDEPAQREMLAYNLEAEGYHVLMADTEKMGYLWWLKTRQT